MRLGSRISFYISQWTSFCNKKVIAISGFIRNLAESKHKRM